jgi:hypothetical protein
MGGSTILTHDLAWLEDLEFVDKDALIYGT